MNNYSALPATTSQVGHGDKSVSPQENEWRTSLVAVLYGLAGGPEIMPVYAHFVGAFENFENHYSEIV